MPAVCCKLHRRHVLLLLFILLLLFGGILLLQELVKTLFSADQFLNVTSISSGVDVTSTVQLNSSTVKDDADECLPALQNLTSGAHVQCIRQPSSSSHNECISASNFWDRQCYLNITESVRFYHLGKGGGGTIFFSLIENGIYVQRDHPRPKHGIDQLLNGPVKTLLVNIRDPVDRFVSAFNWRSLLFCQRDGETRKKYPTEVDVKDRKMHQPHLQPQQVCFDTSVYPQEAKIIQRLYNDDINQLAESLCEESEKFDQAVKTTKFISHAKLSLFQWLHFLVDNGTSSSLIKSQGLDKLMAITVEKRNGYNTSSLIEQTYEAVQQLFFDHGVDEQTFRRLQRHKRNFLQKKRVSDMMVHTSSIPIHNNGTKGHALGTVGECCLARFLENDYRLIQSIVGDDDKSMSGDLAVIGRLKNVHPIIGKACEWGSKRRRQLCRTDLQSMLDRRVKFLDRSLGACRDLVSN
jgi:hypothetical protein